MSGCYICKESEEVYENAVCKDCDEIAQESLSDLSKKMMERDKE